MKIMKIAFVIENVREIYFYTKFIGKYRKWGTIMCNYCSSTIYYEHFIVEKLIKYGRQRFR